MPAISRSTESPEMTSSTISAIRSMGDARRIPLRELRLDDENPRLAIEDRGTDQVELALTLELSFDALTVAESIASHGYFGSEPLIAIAARESDTWTVVEGNRRLTALLGLADPAVRSHFGGSAAWDKLAAQAAVTMDDLIPVVVLENRKQATPIIGFRHISGILSWEPYAQARYIARLVDEEGQSFKQVAETIGVDTTKVGNLYRDQAVVNQARKWGLENGQAEGAFSLLTVAMSTTKLRNHVGAQLGSRTVPGHPPIPSDKATELKEMLTWLYGDDEHEPAIGESRDINKLGNIVASPEGLKALRSGESLEMAIQIAKDAAQDPRGRLLRRLQTGKSSLTAAAEDLTDYTSDDEVIDLISEARAAVDALQVACGLE